MGNEFSKKERGSKERGFYWKLLVISSSLFLLSVFIYAGITFGYAPYLKSQIRDIDSEMRSVSSVIGEEQQEGLVDFYSQLYNISVISATHKLPSKLFSFIEKNTYPEVRLVSVQVNAVGDEIRLDGVASDYNTITNQLSSYQKGDSVLNVTLDSSKQRSFTEGGGVVFSVKVFFKNGYFNTK